MRTKRFNQEVHDAVDSKCGRLVIDYFNRVGFPFYNNVNKYGVDLFSVFTPKLAVEIEHRDCFVDDWPHPSVHIPGRKAKFLINPHVHYVVVSRNFDKIGVCLGHKLLKYPRLREVSNSAVKHGEFFYEIPADQFKWVSISN